MITISNISVRFDPDIEEVFERERGIVGKSPYLNYIVREYFIACGLLPSESANPSDFVPKLSSHYHLSKDIPIKD